MSKEGSVNNGRKAMDLERESKASSMSFDGKGETIELYRGREWLLYGDWLWRFWVYFDTPAHGVSWYAAAGFFFGGICFIIGSFAGIAPAVYNSEVVGNCMGDANDWLVYFLYLLGNTFWIFAVGLQTVEAMNPHYDLNVLEWEKGGRLGAKPRYKWFGFSLALDYAGAWCYTIGVLMYLVAAAASIANDCPATTLDTYVYLWIIDYFYLIAGILFLIAGALYSMQEVSIYLFPAIICPLNRKDATSMKWWALWLYFWGGVGFCMGGIQLYWNSPINLVETIDQYNIITGIGFGGGSVFFTVGAALFLARQSRGRCKPSFNVVGRLDPTTYKGNAYDAPDANGASV